MTSLWQMKPAHPVESAAELLESYEKGERNFANSSLRGGDLTGVDLTGASFYSSDLRDVDFSGSILTFVQLKAANLTRSSITDAWLNATDLIGANFSGATLRNSDFTGASLNRAILSGADLRLANLGNAVLAGANFKGARLSGARLSSTHFEDLDIRPFCDVDRLKHGSPSFVDSRAVIRSVPHPRLKEFMLACGVPPLFCEYMIDCAEAVTGDALRRMMQSTFISYGGPDEPFAREIYDALKARGVVVFFFPETARIGERVNTEVYRQIQDHDRVLLLCSRNSLNRPGVINEIQETLDREARDGGATYLLPITLDDYVFGDWKDAQPDLAERICRRIIGDFRGAADNPRVFEQGLSRVLDALKKKHLRV